MILVEYLHSFDRILLLLTLYAYVKLTEQLLSQLMISMVLGLITKKESCLCNVNSPLFLVEGGNKNTINFLYVMINGGKSSGMSINGKKLKLGENISKLLVDFLVTSRKSIP